VNKMIKKRTYKRLILALTTAVCFVLTTQALFAQDPSITIGDVDSAGFPQMVVPITYDNLSKGFDAESLTLLEDGVPQEISLVAESVSGETQVAFLLALSRGTTYKEPIQSAIRRLLGGGVEGVEPAQVGTIAFFAPDANGALKKMADWSTDNNGTFSTFIGLSLEGPNTNQLNVPQLVQGITEQFDASNVSPKIIFVFSDGTGTSDAGVIQSVRDVAKNAITIHTILLDTGGRENATALRNIATAGGGLQYNFSYKNEQPETLDQLWIDTVNASVASTNGSAVVSYQSGLPQKPEKLTVQVNFDDAGNTLTDETVIGGTPPPPTLTPTPTSTTEASTITINSPDRGQSYRLPWRDTVPSESGAACARTIDVAIAPQMADGATVVAATYRLNGPGYSDEPRTSDVTSAQLCLYSAMLPGNYYVEVTATDDLGRTNIESEVVIDVKPSWWTILLTYLPLILLPVALIALGFTLYALRNQKVVRPVTERLNKSITTMRTEVFRRNSMPAAVDPSQVRARLIRISDHSHLPPEIPLTKESTSIGRDRTFADVAVKDRYISRLHCQISIKDDLFTIQDEGSSSGVYLNDSQTRVDMMGEALRNGDIIHLGPIQYRFEVSAPAANPIPDSQGTEVWGGRQNIINKASAPTEPMNPRMNYDAEQANQKTIKETLVDQSNNSDNQHQSQNAGHAEDPNHIMPTVIDPNIYETDPKSAKTEVYDESPKESQSHSAPTERYNQNRNEEW